MDFFFWYKLRKRKRIIDEVLIAFETPHLHFIVPQTTQTLCFND